LTKALATLIELFPFMNLSGKLIFQVLNKSNGYEMRADTIELMNDEAT
jgi:peptidyl-tRNA hydrolase